MADLSIVTTTIEGRSQEAYDRFSHAVELPLTVLALFWLPVLVVPFVVTLPTDVADTFEAVDYFVWAPSWSSTW